MNTDTAPTVPSPSDRRRELIDLCLQGYSAPELRQYIATEWKEDPDALLPAALDYFAATASEPHHTRLGFCIAAARDIYRRSIEIGDMANALRAIREIAKLSEQAQNAAPDSIRITDADGAVIDPADYE